MQRQNATVGEQTKKGMQKLWTEAQAVEMEDAAAVKRKAPGSDNEADPAAPLEDPVESWVELVEACHNPDKALRERLIKSLLDRARASRWTGQVLAQLDEDFYDSDEEATVGWEEPVDDYSGEEEVLGETYRD